MAAYSYLYSIPYLILFLLLYLNIIPISKSNNINIVKNNLQLQYIFVSVMLILFIGLRGYVYTDWLNYSRTYFISPTLFDGSALKNNFINNKFEIGFSLYMIICRSISSNYLFFQFVSFLIDYIILFYFLKRIIPNNIIMGFLFFIIFSGIQFEFNLLRNSKSIMLFLLSLKYLEEKKFSKYLLLNVIGSLFHVSSVFYIPLYFILNKRIPKKIIFTIFIFGMVIYLLQIEWFKVLLNNIKTIIPGRLGILINEYLSSSFHSRTYGVTLGFSERLFSFILINYYYKELYKENKNNLIFINAFYIYFSIFLFFSEISIIVDRISRLFIFSYWIIYPKIYLLQKKNTKMLFLLILLLFGILKLSVDNKYIYSLYDNVIFNKKSYNEREAIINEYGNLYAK